MHDGHLLPEDEVIDEMDSVQEAERQIELIDHRTNERKRKREKKEKRDNSKEKEEKTAEEQATIKDWIEKNCGKDSDVYRECVKSDSKKEEITGNATTLVPIDNNQNEGIDGIAENATASIPTDNNEEYDVETDVDGHGKDGVDASPYDSDSDSSDSSEDDSDSSNESDSDDEDDVKVPGREVAGANNNVIEEDASMNQLFDTNLFQFKSTWKLAQVLHTMKDAIKYIEDNIEG